MYSKTTNSLKVWIYMDLIEVEILSFKKLYHLFYWEYVKRPKTKRPNDQKVECQRAE